MILFNSKFSLMLLLFYISSSVFSETDSIGVESKMNQPHAPNIIWIVADDLGYGDLGCYGSKDIMTPNIDTLAREGVRFTRFYAASSACTPSRASMLTGRYPNEIGMQTVLMGHGGMTTDVLTVAELLKKEKYSTGVIGKWHLGYEGDSLPTRQGFDEFYGHRGGKIDFFTHRDTTQKVESNKLGKHDLYEGETEVFHKGYTTNLFSERALTFIKDHQQQPFFLYLSYNAPHYANRGDLQAPESYIKAVANNDTPSKRQLYAAMVHCMDDGIGRVLEELKKLNLDKKTVVFFLSDNGADPKHGGSNYPLRGKKRLFDEGGIRVPMIARWPGHIKENSVSQQPIHMIDLLPTSMAIVGSTPPKDLVLPGFNFLESINNSSKLPSRSLYFHRAALIKDKWKLHMQRKTKQSDIPLQLYNLEEDPGEKNNLVNNYPELVKQLVEDCNNRLKATRSINQNYLKSAKKLH